MEQVSRLVYPRFCGGVRSGPHGRRSPLCRRRGASGDSSYGKTQLVTAAGWSGSLFSNRNMTTWWTSSDGLPQLVELAWMLQEFRVSVFAQSLGVKGTVSEKRLRRALEEAAG